MLVFFLIPSPPLLFLTCCYRRTPTTTTTHININCGDGRRRRRRRGRVLYIHFLGGGRRGRSRCSRCGGVVTTSTSTTTIVVIITTIIVLSTTDILTATGAYGIES